MASSQQLQKTVFLYPYQTREGGEANFYRITAQNQLHCGLFNRMDWVALWEKLACYWILKFSMD